MTSEFAESKSERIQEQNQRKLLSNTRVIYRSSIQNMYII